MQTLQPGAGGHRDQRQLRVLDALTFTGDKRPSLLDSQGDPLDVQEVDVGGEYEEEDEEEEEEEIEESALASVQFDTVASVIDFLTNRF